jgi:hypothetical protein
MVLELRVSLDFMTLARSRNRTIQATQPDRYDDRYEPKLWPSTYPKS